MLYIWSSDQSLNLIVTQLKYIDPASLTNIGSFPLLYFLKESFRGVQVSRGQQSELPSKRVNTYSQAESLSSGVHKRVKLNNNEGPVKPYSQLKPANYELRAPVLRHIFSGTFHSAAFNVQVRPELS